MVRNDPEIRMQAVISVLNELEQAGAPANKIVSKSEICRRAGVSRTILRTHSDLMAQVNNYIKEVRLCQSQVHTKSR